MRRACCCSMRKLPYSRNILRNGGGKAWYIARNSSVFGSSVVNISPSPVRSQCSQTWKVRQIRRILDSVNLDLPIAHPDTVDWVSPSSFANSDCVSLRVLRNKATRFCNVSIISIIWVIHTKIKIFTIFCINYLTIWIVNIIVWIYHIGGVE